MWGVPMGKLAPNNEHNISVKFCNGSQAQNAVLTFLLNNNKTEIKWSNIKKDFKK